MLREMINKFWDEFWYELNAEAMYARACIAIASNTESLSTEEREEYYTC